MKRMFAASLGLLLLASAIPGMTAAPGVALAQEPLYSGRANVHPNLLLSLSVEFPTVGLAYRGDGGTYNRTREYIGYFNPSKCYVYKGGNRNLGDDAYFVIHADADPETRECDGASFSGNFMNWASASAIDMLRYALTGGDRVVDEPDLTVLQRAVLYDGPGGNFYADGTYFPRRTLKKEGNASAPGKVTPFAVNRLYVVSCRNRILFSDEKSNVVGGSAAASDYCISKYDGKGKLPQSAIDKKLGEYLVRVQVCDEDEGPERTDLCQKYGEHYKPVGELQRNAMRVRVGAMGYLLDDAAERYGGVLRAPLKYLGAKRFLAPGYTASDNDRPEWDEQTGVFHSNPEQPEQKDSTTANSGVINYLNKFGRTARYKMLDPVGELYYEGLRYLQGRQPTPAATADMTDGMKDGFPVLEAWQDPVTASCQRNYILTIADVNTHWDRYIPGNTRTKFGNNEDAHDSARNADAIVPGATPGLDVKVWTEKVGQMEVDAGNAYGNPAPNAELADLHERDTGSGGHGTYYMAGLAYWANTHDIRLDKPVRVKTFAIDVDEGGDGKIDGNQRALKPRNSQLYLAAKYGGFEDRNGDGNPFVTYDADGQTVLVGNNREWDNGEGVPANYFLAGQPTQMIAAIRRVFSTITASSGTLGGVGLSSSKLGAGGAYVYQPGFDPARWSGSLRKLAIGFNEAGLSIAQTAQWDAGDILTGDADQTPNPQPDERNIYTLKAGPSGTAMAEFKWDALDAGSQDALNIAPSDGLEDGLGPARLAWLRGVREREIGQKNGMFRLRDRVLGDIVNSNPVYVGAPAARARGDGYAAFLDANKSRSPAVYVGANDGMLHAFDADTGVELFAYVPRALIPFLPQLTRPDYVHRPYVDGGLAAEDALVGGKWKTVLAGALGAGAQGVFALDITDPGAFSDGGGILWEFTDADDADMGNVIGAPQVARFRTGVNAGVPQYGDFVVVASGLNNYVEDGEGRHNDDAAGVLFILSLDKPLGEPWKEGVNYHKIRLPAAEGLSSNGLAQPALVPGLDGAIRRAYLGDLQGGLWRLDFGVSQPWSVTGSAQPMFVARTTGGKRQPITTRPLVAFGPGGGYLVMFGTGKFVEQADAAPGAFQTQTFYAIHDTGGTIAGRSALVEREAEAEANGTYSIVGDVLTYGSTGKKGWYLDFPDSATTGERAATDAVLRDGTIYFNSLIPGSDPCAAGGGASYQIDALTGFPPGGAVTRHVSQVGLLGTPIVLDLGVTVGQRNAIGERIVKRRQQVVNVGTGGAKGMLSPAEDGYGETTQRAGRFSWREILNWQELRDALAKK